MWILAALLAAHGSWVYKRNGLDEARMQVLVDSTKAGLNELWVSIAALPMDDPTTPAKIKRLKRAGLRVEALIDGPEPRALIERIVAYNSAHPDAPFDGVHYDFEPWIGTGTDISWVPTLSAAHDVARSAAAALPVTVDVSGVKARAVPELKGRVVLMHYEATPDRVKARTQEVIVKSNASFMIALRVKDFGCDVMSQLQRAEADWKGNPRYAGWAIYEYEDYAAKCL